MVTEYLLLLIATGSFGEGGGEWIKLKITRWEASSDSFDCCSCEAGSLHIVLAVLKLTM